MLYPENCENIHQLRDGQREWEFLEALALINATSVNYTSVNYMYTLCINPSLMAAHTVMVIPS